MDLDLAALSDEIHGPRVVTDAPRPDGPMLDDLDEPQVDADDYPDCRTCGGVGTLSVTSKGATTYPDCPHCNRTGVEPR